LCISDCVRLLSGEICQRKQLSDLVNAMFPEENVSCPNAEFCLVWEIPRRVLDCHRGTCMNCAIHFGRELKFTSEETECPVCLETTKKNMFHPSGCRHIFCVACVRRLFFPEREDTSKEYGAPQERDFPDCEAFEDAWDAWIETEIGQLWNAIDSEEELAFQDSAIEECPICRSKKDPDWKTGCGNWCKPRPE
jgi:hypothetical protein